MSVTLYELPHSPYCIPVVRLLENYGVPCQRVEVPAWDRRELIRLTQGAYYMVPVIQDGDTVVHETAADPLAVPHYLDRVYAGGALFPETWAGIHDLIVNHIEDAVEGAGFKLTDPYYLDTFKDLAERTMVIRHKERKFGRGCVETWRHEAPRLRREFEALLEPFEARLEHSRFLFGEDPVYADYALYGVIGNVTYRGWNQLDPRFGALQVWQKLLESWRPS